MIAASNPLPDDKDALKAALIEARAKLSGAEAMIAHLQLVIAKMKREMFGPRKRRRGIIWDEFEQMRCLVNLGLSFEDVACLLIPLLTNSYRPSQICPSLMNSHLPAQICPLPNSYRFAQISPSAQIRSLASSYRPAQIGGQELRLAVQ